ncbi:carbonic anhydrase [Chthonobacter rhizosphaerae]|uniref:carbonic anhydrase n=1 Tax=Chthonobacter rhizosphaerae TaxID=2735553 RepID=UPI0015EFAE84|nr:carbonic anhydrase [Chthonobacter rhizosphaerae]
MSTESSLQPTRPPLPDAFPDRLVTGYQSFRTGRYPTEEERYRRLGDLGQKPEIMVIGCCDSRVSPEVIFDTGPGEIFVVRNVANLVPPYTPDGELHGTSAALEFAVVALKVRHIVVMGHGRCGGIHAALAEGGDPLTPGDFIGKWMSLMDEPANRVRCDHTIPQERKQRALEHEAVRVSVRNLMTFPCVQTRTAKGSLRLHGAWFDVSEGALHVLDPATGAFRVVDDEDSPFRCA